MGAQGSEIITNITKQIHLCTSAPPPKLNTQNLLNNPLSFFFICQKMNPLPQKKRELLYHYSSACTFLECTVLYTLDI